MKRKFFFFDIDGTLIDCNLGIYSISDNVKEALDKLKENGHDVFLATGRCKCFIVDEVMNGNIQLIINTPAAKEEKLFDDSYIRKTAIKAKVPYFTTMAAAKATAEGIYTVIKEGEIGVMSLQEIHASIN